jgi:signal recognition particle subunit SRP54
MLQQMQRQLRSGGGMQEMMKAMMQGQGGDQFDMEEMQSTSKSFSSRNPYANLPIVALGMMGQMNNGLGGLGGLGGLPSMGGGMPNLGDMFKMMGMGGNPGR